MPAQLVVYLSSTLSDLGPERQAVKDALGGDCVVKESYHADERNLRDACVDDVAACDLYIGILGLRYGFVPPGSDRSITQIEYEAAPAGKRLMFLKDEEAILYKLTDAFTKEHPTERIEAFRKRVNDGSAGQQRGAMFKTPDELKFHVHKALVEYQKRHGQAGRSPAIKLQGPPYPGLKAFKTDQADRFFGRDVEADELLERLVAKGERFIAVIGASGSGKSSLVYAGLIPRLIGTPTVAGTRWVPLHFAPRGLGDDPFQPLALEFAKAFPDRDWRPRDLRDRLAARAEAIGDIAKEALGDEAASSQIVLFVDQFEEVFAAKVAELDRQAFFRTLAAAVGSRQVRVIIAMRSDFYSQWPQDQAYVRLLREGHFPVGVPDQAALAKMIEEPARAAGRSVPPRLVQRILADTGTAPGALALVASTMSRLFDRDLTEAAYDAIGRVAGAIDNQATEALKNCGTVDDDTLSRLFVALATVEERGADLALVRRRAPKADLPPDVAAVAEALENARLLTSSAATPDHPAVVEVSHEAIFEHWRRFRDWADRYRGELALQREAEHAALQWDAAGRPRARAWTWERQKPALEALHRLRQLDAPVIASDFTDPGIAIWRVVEPSLAAQPALRDFLRPEPLTLLEELESKVTPHHRREQIGLRLHQMGDPRRGVGLDANGVPEIAWVDVPAGRVVLETNERHSFKVRPFRLARYPVTWSQYLAFLKAEDGYWNASWWEVRPHLWTSSELLWAFDNYPAINVSWYDAMAFCRWLSSKLGFEVRLPTEWEWQWAAGGDQKHPWPGDWDYRLANFFAAGIGRTVAVGLYPPGRSPFDLDDMAGNVLEWCSNTYKDLHTDDLASKSDRVVRGGSYFSFAEDCRVAPRCRHSPDTRFNCIGFRLCYSSPIE